jgi:hypothetical protein
MANFKVGDRVRIVDGVRPEMIGAEGVLVAAGGWSGKRGWWLVDVPSHPTASNSNVAPPTYWDCHRSILAPLTPPAEDAWAADKVKELTRPKPMDVEREPVRVPEGDKLPSLRDVLRYYDSLHRKPAP